MAYSSSYLKKHELEFDTASEWCEDISFVFQATLSAQCARIINEIFYVYKRREGTGMTDDDKAVSRFKGRFIAYVQSLMWGENNKKKISKSLCKHLGLYYNFESDVFGRKYLDHLN